MNPMKEKAKNQLQSAETRAEVTAETLLSIKPRPLTRKIPTETRNRSYVGDLDREATQKNIIRYQNPVFYKRP